MTDAVADCTASPAVASDVLTEPVNVRTPEIPPGVVETFVVSAMAPTQVYASAPIVTVRPGEGLTDTDLEGFAIRHGTIAQAGRERVFELSFQEALLNDGLEREGEVLDAHVGPLREEVWVWRSRE